MEEELRALFESKIQWAASKPDPYRAAASIFSRRRPTVRKPVNIEERTDDLVSYIETNCQQADDGFIEFDDLKLRFEEYRRANRQSRVSWNSSFHIAAFEKLGAELVDNLELGTKMVRGLAWR